MSKLKVDVPYEVGSTKDMHKVKYSLGGMIFFIYCMCAAGAFGIEAMVPAAGPGMTILILCILPLVWALPIGTYCSELSAMAPVDSGPYVWMKMAFGEFWGFTMDWWMILATYLGQASYVVLAVGYIDKLVPMSPTAQLAIKVLLVLIMVGINLWGLKELSTLSMIFTFIILIAFALVTIFGFANWNYNPVDPFMAGDDWVSSFGIAICVGIWMYCGYPAISSLAGEVENPQIIPKAMRIAIILIAISYILPTLAGLCSVGPWYEWGSDIGGSINYATVLTEHLGLVGGIFFTAVAVISNFAICNTGFASGSRMWMVLAEDGLSPQFLIKLSKRKMPYWPILIMGIIAIIFVNFDFSVIVTIISPLLFVIYGGLALAFLKLRKKYPVEERGDVYYAKGGKVVVIYVVAALLLFGTIGMLVNGTEYFLLGFIAILSTFIAYPIIKAACGGFNRIDSSRWTINPKTKMAPGDIGRIGVLFIIFGLFMFGGSFFLAWYEGSWGPEYYAYMYGDSIMGNFYGMLGIARYGGLVVAAIGVVLKLVGKKVDPPVELEMKEID